MNRLLRLHTPRTFLAITLTGMFFSLANINYLHAQTPSVDAASHAAHVASGKMPPTKMPDVSKTDTSLSQQLTQSQAKIAQLQAAIAKSTPMLAAAAPMPGMPAGAPTTAPAMTMKDDKMGGDTMPAAPMVPTAVPMAAMNSQAAPPMGMMGMMDKMMGMMDKMMSMDDDKMGGAAMPDPAPMAGGMGMMAMDKMEMAGMMGMSPMASLGGSPADTMPPSALPGFPGASHLYHIGSTGFFLDHSQHITLTTEQQAALNKIKEQAALSKSTVGRTREQAEQALWTLTSADQPDAVKIKAKISEIAGLQTDERFAFIQSVGNASKLLTDDQRKILTGFAPPATTTPAMPAAGMSDM